MKEKAIICGHIGEFGWECIRFAPHVLWLMKNKYSDCKLILAIYKERTDLYGDLPEIIEPLNIPNSEKADCFKITGFTIEEYKKLQIKLITKYQKDYDIITTFFPKIEGRKYTEKFQIPESEKLYNFKPRQICNDYFLHYIPKHRPIITLAPRYRKGYPRNWNHWLKFYQLLKDDIILNKFTYVICGKLNEYIKSNIDNFYDINVLPKKYNITISGLTIASIKNSICLVGSQSALPTLSNLLGIPTLQWGNEKKLHSETYNIKNTKTKFIEDLKFNKNPEIIINELKNFLKEI